MTTQANDAVADISMATIWKERKLKFLAKVRTSNVDKHVVDSEIPVSLCNYTDVYYNEHITSDLPFMQVTATESEIQRFGLKEGQVLLTKDSESWDDIAVPACVAETMFNVVCGYHLAIVDPCDSEMSGRFLGWLAQSPALNDQFKLAAKGVTRFGLSQYALKNAVVKIPPLPYQQKIADFLDRKTAEIDTLIAKKRRLLDLLAEKRTALITRAVTKGLNPDVPMKDSGIEWLGEIPAHWNQCQLKRTWYTSDYGLSDSIRNDYGVPVLRMSCIVDGRIDVNKSGLAEDVDDYLLLKKNDLLFNRTNSLDQIAKVGRLDFDPEYPISFASYLVRIRTNKLALPSYLTYLLNSRPFLNFARANAIPAIGQANLNPSRYGQIHIPLPDLYEQEKIVNAIETDEDAVRPLEEQVVRSIDSLNEKRSALITNAVTGQIKVA